MKNITLGSFHIKLLTLVIFAAVGIWIAEKIVGPWMSLELSGAFVKWKFLDGPQRFQKIVTVHDFELRAQTEDGKVYSYTTEWKEWQRDPEYVPTRFNDISSNCESLFAFTAMKPRYPPPEAGAPVQCGVYEQRHPFAGPVDTAYYVLLDSGKLWMWRHTRAPQREIIILLAGLFIGLIVGIIAWLLIQKWI